MSRHRLDPLALIAGIAFAAIAVTRLLDGSVSLLSNIGVVVPLALIATGAVILLSDRRRAGAGQAGVDSESDDLS